MSCEPYDKEFFLVSKIKIYSIKSLTNVINSRVRVSEGKGEGEGEGEGDVLFTNTLHI